MATVLLIEDHPANRKLARLILENAGHRVECSENAVDGLRLAEASQPDVILMDIQLPVLDGLEATRRLKSNPATSGIPVIALTAFAMRSDEQKMRSAGCDGYLAKPYRSADLRQVVAAALRRVHPATSPAEGAPHA